MQDLKVLINRIKKYNPQAEVDLITKAYLFSKESHEKQYRESGERFIRHPLQVAEVLANLELDTTTIAAALLHDVAEDTEVSLKQLEARFGREVCLLIDGVTKLSRIKFKTQEEAQAENLRKMFVAMAEDIRVILIKLADRLHNMRTLCYLSSEKRQRIALETLEIYAPLAHRLGIFQLKWELEDLAFEALEPKKYAQIKKMVAEGRKEREKYLDAVVLTVSQRLEAADIKCEIVGRIKHFYSIYQKMVRRDKDFNEIYDLSAVRVLVDSVKDCYGALGIIHALWKPVPGRIKDYIAQPKFNMYQSLHTTVIGLQGRPLEIQIRTKEMHRTAEFGVAAHWRYKEKIRKTDKLDDELTWLRQILEWQRELKDPREFMESLKLDLFEDEVFVFTPKGDVIRLPAGSTPLDLAYNIHTEVGHQCIGAKINDQIVPLEYKLQMGDIVEILTSKSAHGPSKDWLSLVKTSRARSKIRQWLSKEVKEDSEHLGREELQKVLRKQRITLTSSQRKELLKKIAKESNFRKTEDLYASIGAGKTSAKQVVTKIINALTSGMVEEERMEVPTPPRKRISSRVGVKVKGIDEVLVRLARCCNPVPEDEIIGFITRGRGVSIHRKDCSNAKELLKLSDRLIEVEWDVRGATAFQVEIQVEALDRVKLLRDVSSAISDCGINILSAQVNLTKDRFAIFRFVFEVSSLAHLGMVLENVKKVDAVFDAYRL